MSVYIDSGRLNITHSKRIDRIVCQMHADRARLLALEADAGFPPRSVRPVRVEIRRKQDPIWVRLLERAGFRRRVFA